MEGGQTHTYRVEVCLATKEAEELVQKRLDTVGLLSHRHEQTVESLVTGHVKLCWKLVTKGVRGNQTCMIEKIGSARDKTPAVLRGTFSDLYL